MVHGAEPIIPESELFPFAAIRPACYLARMKFSVTDQSRGNTVQAYSEAGVVINGATFSRSLVIMEDQLIPDWQPKDFKALTEEDFTPFLKLRPDIVLLGTGDRQQFPTPALYRELIGAGIGVEVMTTPAACRTYNILVGEGRRVIAALLFD